MATARSHTLYLIEKGNAGLLRAVDVLAGCRPDSFSRHALKFIEQAIVEAAAGS